MYIVILGTEDLYYEKVTERELMVFKDRKDAKEFAFNYRKNPLDDYIKVIDENGIICAYDKNVPSKKKGNIGFG